MHTFTHKGWLGICPVYIGGLDDEGPVIAERHWSFIPLMKISEFMQRLCRFVLSAINPHYEPMWAIRVTGELPNDRESI